MAVATSDMTQFLVACHQHLIQRVPPSTHEKLTATAQKYLDKFQLGNFKFDNGIDISLMESPVKLGEIPTEQLVTRPNDCVNIIKNPLDVKHRMVVRWGDKAITARLVHTTSGFCESGTLNITYTYRLSTTPIEVTLVWSSCRGKCHSPSMRSSSSIGIVVTSTGNFPQDGQFQQLFGSFTEERKHLCVDLALCHELHVFADDPVNEHQSMQEACLSVLAICNTPPPQATGFRGTDAHWVYSQEIDYVLTNVARMNESLSVLNNVGVFAHVDTPREIMEEAYKKAGNSVPTEWLDGALGGLRPRKRQLLNVADFIRASYISSILSRLERFSS